MGQAAIAIRLTDGKTKSRHGGLSRLVFVLAFAMILLSAASLAYVGNIAAHEADAQAMRTEKQLLENVLSDRMRLMSRDLYSVIHWDDAVDKLVKTLNQTFVTEELIYWLDLDLQAQRTFIIAGNGRVLADIVNSGAQFTNRSLGNDDPLMQLARKAIDRFVRLRVPVEGGYSLKSLSPGQIGDLAETAVMTVEGQPSLVTAMAVTPAEEAVLPARSPSVVLLSARTLDSHLLADLDKTLSFRNFTFEPADFQEDLRTTLPATGPDGTSVGVFAWQGARPGSAVWSVIMPVILAVCGLMTVVTAFAAFRIGALSLKLEKSEARNRFLALHDNLTGLSNRFHFHEALDAHIIRLPQNEFAVLACDLDHFKVVNDSFGHAAGDRVICTVANRLGGAIGTAGMVGRVGGDEFVILLNGFTDIPRIQVLCRQIIASVCEPILLENGQIACVGVSLGVALAPASGSTNMHLMASADAALYAAKERGRGCVVFAHELPRDHDEGSSTEAGPSVQAA